MKRVRCLLATFSISFILIGTLAGQALGSDYRTAIGLRSGETTGISLKFNTKNTANYELLLGLWSNWLSVSGLYEIKAPAFSIVGMNWYYGAGGHVSLETGTYYPAGRDYGRGNDFALGIDGIVGIEYKIPQIPIAISLDIKPFIDIFRDGELYLAIDPGIGIKFTF